MASRRYRARNSLNGTVTNNNARINTVEKRSIPTRIANGAIDGALLADNSVTAQTLAPASVQTENIAAGAITTGLIADASITATKLSADALANVPVGVDSVYTSAIQNLAVTNAKLAGSISGDKLLSLDASKIGSGTFDASRIPDLAASKITSGEFAAARIPTLDIGTKTSGNLSLDRVSTGGVTFGSNYLDVGGARVGQGAAGYSGSFEGQFVYSTNFNPQTNYPGVGGGATFSGQTANFGGPVVRTQLAGGGTTTASFTDSGSLVRTASSRRYKQDIQSLTVPYEALLQLQPKIFRWIEEVETTGEDAKYYPGFIAEELAETGLDIFVFYSKDEDGNPRPEGIHYAELTAALVSGIKHQHETITALEARLAAIEARLSE